MRAAPLLTAALLAACGRVASPPGDVRLLCGERAARGFSVSPDGRRAAWVDGEWPDRTSLVLLDVASGRRESVRHKGYSLVETAFAPGGGLKVLARKPGAAESPHVPPKRAAILSVDERGALLSAEDDPAGRIVERKPVPWHQGAEPAFSAEGEVQLVVRGPGGTVWVGSSSRDGSRYAVESFDERDGRRLAHAEVPGPVESLLPAGDALYVLTRSSESLSGAVHGPRLLAKVDLLSGRPAWTAPWAPRRSALLARSPEGRIFAAVRDPHAPSLWSFEDAPESAAAAGRAASAPGAGRARKLRNAALFLARFLPALLLAGLFFAFRR